MEAKKDQYGGIQLSSENIPAQFDLGHEIECWKKDGVRSVQAQFRPPYCGRIDEFAKHGFYFHHAKNDYIWMILWLDPNVTDRMPKYADHYVGVGGVVIN